MALYFSVRAARYGSCSIIRAEDRNAQYANQPRAVNIGRRRRRRRVHEERREGMERKRREKRREEKREIGR
jgi:hypothetical protein